MKVYSPKDNHKLSKILFTAQLYRKDLTHQPIDYDTKVPKNFKQVYPAFSIPALQIEAGKYIFGTNTILLHLSLSDEKVSAFQKAKTYEYLQYLEKQIQAATGIIVLHQRKCAEVKETQFEKAVEILAGYGKQINQKLALKTFLVGDKANIADISVFYNLRQVKETMKKSWEKFKNLDRWMIHMQSLVESV